MKNSIEINDYDLAFSASGGWAKVEIFGKEISFDFLQTDAITAAIELDIINQPDDRDDDRIGYEKSLFSATSRESFDYAKRIQYQFNSEALREFSGTDFAEQIVSKLASQSQKIKEVIQAEATAIACCDIPANITDPADIKYNVSKQGFPKDFVVNWQHVSLHKIAGLRTENKLVEKLL